MFARVMVFVVAIGLIFGGGVKEPGPVARACLIGETSHLAADNVTFYVQWDQKVTHFNFSLEDQDGWHNYTLLSASGKWTNYTHKVWVGVGKIANWTIDANSTNGWGSTGLQSFTAEKIEYGTVATQEVEFLDANITDPQTWQTVLSGQSVYQDNDWNTFWFGWGNSIGGKWVKFTSISTEESANYIRGYEVEVYDRISARWKSPTFVYSSCGGSNQVNFVDGNTGTYWSHSAMEYHEIVVELDKVYEINRVRIYAPDNQMANWTSFNIKVGVDDMGGWSCTGTAPFVNGTDYPGHYISSSYGGSDARGAHVTGSFKFADYPETSNYTIMDAEISVNMSGSNANITLQYISDRNLPDSPVYWYNQSFATSGSGWEVVSEKVKFIYSPLYLDNITCRLVHSNDYAVKVDYIQISYVRYTKNETIQLLHDTLYIRRINGTFPWIRQYAPYTHSFQDECREELLAAIQLYQFTNNETYLDVAQESATYIQNSPAGTLFRRWNITSGDWTWYHAGSISGYIPLYSLAQLVNENPSWSSLLAREVNFYYNNFINHSSNMVYRALDSSKNPKETYIVSDTAFGSISGLAYAGWVLGNQTLKTQALNCLLAWGIGSYNLPYHDMWNNGSPKSAYAKTTTTGTYILCASQLYYITNNQTLYDTWKNVTEYAVHYQWDDTQGFREQISGETRSLTWGWDGQFEYQTFVNTGLTKIEGMVKGSSYLREALIHSYLVFENQTFLDRIVTEIHFAIINGTARSAMGAAGLRGDNYGSHLRHDLLFHGTVGFYSEGNTDSDIRRTSPSVRSLQLLYSLNKTANFDCVHLSGQVQDYHMSKWQEAYKMMYFAALSSHFVDFGLSNCLTNTNALEIGNEATGIVSLQPIFRYLFNETSDDYAINSFTDIYEKWGNPWTGEVYPITPILNSTEHSRNVITSWSADYDKTFSQVNASPCFDNVENYHFNVEWSNSIRRVFRVGESLNIIVAITSDAKTVCIWALEDEFWSYSH